jgi:glycosyltransferase involved in cell wall biosynthesis
MISVIMAVFNGEEFLHESVESILQQTYKDFEFIIIDDGSSDRTRVIMDEYDDPRIVRINHPNNLGLVRSLNDGLSTAQGKYMARMDVDDISLEDRFEKQIHYLETHPDTKLLGGQVKEIGIRKTGSISELPLSYPHICWKMCFSNPFRHPTIMADLSIIKSIHGYQNYQASEDYDLWQRLAETSKVENLQDVLVFYRNHGKNLSSLPNKSRISERNEIRQRAISFYLGQSSQVDWDCYWKNPYYRADVILQIYKKSLKQVSKEEKKKIRKETGTLIFDCAKSIKQRPGFKQMLLLFRSVYHDTGLIKPIFKRIVKKLQFFQ